MVRTFISRLSSAPTVGAKAKIARPTVMVEDLSPLASMVVLVLQVVENIGDHVINGGQAR